MKKLLNFEYACIQGTYWMLYTDDSENSNTAWGQIEYDGKIYGSAALGAGELVIKDGLTYIWYYQAL